MFANWKLIGAVGAAILLGIAVAWLINIGRQLERGEQDRNSMENWRDRSAIENELQKDDREARCRRLGGGDACVRLPNVR